MKKVTYIYENDDHKWAMVARDPGKAGYIIDTNEYIILDGQEALLTDPGGVEIFASVFSAISSELDVSKIRAIFASHQDPDIISSLALWLEANPDLKCYTSWLWSGFIPHFGGNDKTFDLIPDEGKTIRVGSKPLELVPAHHLHSAGNFHLYDPTAKIYFSGDVGAALLPDNETDIYVEDFEKHIKYATKFHQRWMGSNEAKLKWCERVRKMDIDLMCPQHGAIYRGKDVERFIEWFGNLPVGVF